MITCSVYGCTNTILTDSSVDYHPFPKNVFSEQWIQACGWQEDPIDINTAHVCSIHFEESAYTTELKVIEYNVCYIKTLKHDAVPTLYLPKTQLIIKEADLGNLNNIVVYTLTPAEYDNEIASIALANDAVGKPQLFELEPSSSNVKTERQLEPQKKRLSNKTDNIINCMDLHALEVLQAQNKILKKKIEVVEQEIADFENTCQEKESICRDIEREYVQIETKIKKRVILTQQEQHAILSKVFSESQIKILFGRKKVAWSDDDMAVGYTIRHLSNKRCYAYLTKNLNIPLPAISSIKRWITEPKGKKLKRKKKAERSALTE